MTVSPEVPPTTPATPCASTFSDAGHPRPLTAHLTHPRRSAPYPSGPARVVARLADYRPPIQPAVSVRPNLSDREVEVLLAWLGAESKEEAAAHLFISASTVSTHLARIRAKYTAVGRSAPTKTHLFARAIQDGYTTVDRW